MPEHQSLVGIVWMGGKNRRFHKTDGLTDSKYEYNKILAPLGGKPLFLWAFEAASTIVDRCALSFHTSRQYDRFSTFWDQSSLELPPHEVVIDSPRIPSRGPIQAQLTVLHAFPQAKKLLTVSADMPFLPTHALQALVDTTDAISTVQSTKQIIEPLISCYTRDMCRFAAEFLSFFPFGRADDLQRAVETLSVITIPSDYSMETTPWNQDINFQQDLIELNQKIKSRGIILIRKNLSFDQETSFERKRVINSGNHTQKLKDIFASPLDLYKHQNGNTQPNAYEKLVREKSYFYAGRLAELLTRAIPSPIDPSTWYSKAAHCYWNETQFWLKNDVPFLAMHALFDCTHCLKASSIDHSWEDKTEILMSQLQQQLNFSRGKR